MTFLFQFIVLLSYDYDVFLVSQMYLIYFILLWAMARCVLWHDIVWWSWKCL